MLELVPGERSAARWGRALPHCWDHAADHEPVSGRCEPGLRGRDVGWWGHGRDYGGDSPRPVIRPSTGFQDLLRIPTRFALYLCGSSIMVRIPRQIPTRDYSN